MVLPQNSLTETLGILIFFRFVIPNKIPTMNIKKLLIQSIGFLFLSVMAFASGGVKTNEDPLLKTFITNRKQIPDRVYQNHLRSLPAWTDFSKKHNSWMVVFNEGNQKPHRAVGAPIFTGGSSA